MKNKLSYFGVICLMITSISYGANDLEKLNSISPYNMDYSGLCTGFMVVLNSSGKQETVKMTSCVANNASDCSDTFLSWLKLESAKYPKVISSSSNYNEGGE